MTEAKVIHEEIETPFSIAMNCEHVPSDADHICWNCTVKIIDLSERMEDDLTTARKECDDFRAEADRLREALHEVEAHHIELNLEVGRP